MDQSSYPWQQWVGTTSQPHLLRSNLSCPCASEWGAARHAWQLAHQERSRSHPSSASRREQKTCPTKMSKSSLSTAHSGHRRKCLHHPLVELDGVFLQQANLKKKVYSVVVLTGLISKLPCQKCIQASWSRATICGMPIKSILPYLASNKKHNIYITQNITLSKSCLVWVPLKINKLWMHDIVCSPRTPIPEWVCSLVCSWHQEATQATLTS